jgi:preprotein translocase subunit SecF
MGKFLAGLLVGLVIGLLSSSYFSGPDLDAFTAKARSMVSKHYPVNN